MASSSAAKIAIILGTRPEIIKFSPIIRLLEKEKEKNGKEYLLIHTNQHYSAEMDEIFFKELNLPAPTHNLEVGSGTHGKQTGIMLERIEKVLMEDKPDVVLVEGDTNTVVAGAMAAAKMGIKVGHVEAGLRSYDMTMPEELNRIIADHISTYLFCPTEESCHTAEGEGIKQDKVLLTGNTIVDAVFQNLELAKEKSTVFRDLDLEKDKYLVLTLHRPGNVDDKDVLEKVIKGLALVHVQTGLPIIYPMHPRTEKMVKRFGLDFGKGVKVIEPVGFLDFLNLEANARLVLTDSGGVQEETCILKVPCVTLRENTERPETISVGSNILAGMDPDRISGAVEKMMAKEREWDNPFGKGDAAEKILASLNR